MTSVASVGVLVEGNSFSRFINTDYFVIVRRPDVHTIKKSAKNVLAQASAVFISGYADGLNDPLQEDHPTVFTESTLPLLVSHLRNLTSIVT